MLVYGLSHICRKNTMPLTVFNSTEVFYFVHPSCPGFTGNGFQQPGPLSVGPHKACFPGGAGWRVRCARAPFSPLPSYSDHFPSHVQEAVSALRALHMLNTYINFLGKNLALNLFVCNNAHCRLGDTVDSSGFAMAMLVGHSFLNGAPSSDVYNCTFLADSHVCGQRNSSVFSKRPRECRGSASPLPLGQSLRRITGRWRSSQKDNIYFTNNIISAIYYIMLHY